VLESGIRRRSRLYHGWVPAFGRPESEVTQPKEAVNRQAEWKENVPLPTFFLDFIKRTFGPYAQLVEWIEKAVNGAKFAPAAALEFATDKVRNGAYPYDWPPRHTWQAPPPASGALYWHSRFIRAFGSIHSNQGC